MKLKFVAAMLLCTVVASAAHAQQYIGGPAGFDIQNHTPMPLFLTFDDGSKQIFVSTDPRSGDTINIPPGGDIAKQIRRGRWDIICDGQPVIQFDAHYRSMYRLELKPYAHGYEHGVLGIIDDGYRAWSEPVVRIIDRPDVVMHPPRHEHNRPDRYDPYYVDPRHTPFYQDDDNLGAELGHNLADAIGNALDGFLHRNDQPQAIPVIPHGW